MRTMPKLTRLITVAILVVGCLIAYNSVFSPPSREGPAHPFSLVPYAYATDTDTISNRQIDTLKAYILQGDTLFIQEVAQDTIPYRITSWPSIMYMAQTRAPYPSELGHAPLSHIPKKNAYTADTTYTIGLLDTCYIVIYPGDFQSEYTDSLYLDVVASNDSGDVCLEFAYGWKLIEQDPTSWRDMSYTTFIDSITTEDSTYSATLSLDVMAEILVIRVAAITTCDDYVHLDVVGHAFKRQDPAVISVATYKSYSPNYTKIHPSQ